MRAAKESTPVESPGARLDDLRRRIYRADATEEDRRRYLEQLAEEPAPEPQRVAPGPRPRRRGALAIGAGFVVVAALAVAVRVSLATAPAAIVARPTTSAAATAPALSSGVVDVGDGDLLPLAATAPTGPTPVAASVDGMSVAGQRFAGAGNAVVAFDPPEGAWNGGRLSVSVTSTQPARIAWRSLLVVTRTDWSSYPLVLASGTATDRSGAHAPTVFVYPNRPPTKIAIEAPPGVDWILVVAATGSQAGFLH